VILYPTGGGTGLVGMWKAFDEMETMGWIGSARPRMVSGAGGGLRANRASIRVWGHACR
jgi:threonine synthase